MGALLVYSSPRFTVPSESDGVHDSSGRFSFVLAENGQSLVNENPDQPASKGAFIFEVWRIAQCDPPAASYGNGCVLLTQYSASDEVK